MHSEFQPSRRQFIYAVKAFAILSVICAHVAHVSELSNPGNIIAGNILISLGSIGVAIFFILSGFLFANGDKDLLSFFKKRVTTILIPWVATGSVVYCYVAIRKTGVNVIDWLGFIVGNQSYLYFLSMLMMCYLVSFYINKSRTKLALIMVLSLVSILLTSNNMMAGINPYMNPFNWFFYFGFGYLLFDLEKLQPLMVFARKWIVLCSVIFLSCLLVFSKNGYVGYWSKEYLFFELTSVICVFGLCTFPVIYQSRMISMIGKESFSIYLLHMPFAGIVAHYFGKIDFAPLTLIRPFVVLLVTVIFVYSYKVISTELRASRFLPMLIGSRE